MELLRLLALTGIVAIAAILSACGGGGGNSVTDTLSSSDRTIILSDENSELHKSECGTVEKPLRIMPLGDSITESTVGHSSYRKHLYDLLTKNGCVVDFVGSRHGVSDGVVHSRERLLQTTDFDQDHEGHWGFRADQILLYISEWAHKNVPDLALVHLGTNDIFQSQSVDSTLAEMEEVINELRLANPKVRILLAQIIPSSRARNEIESFNKRIPELANSLSTAESPVRVVDQFHEFFVSSDTFDNIHPNDSGELKMASRWFNAIMEIWFA